MTKASKTKPSDTNPTKTQTLILSSAAQRPGNLALPLPKTLVGAAAKMTVTKMIERGWLQEVEANLRKGEPLWRETADGHGTTLIVTNAGLLAIGIDPVVVKTVGAVRKQADEAATPAPKVPVIRAGTKQATLIAMLRRPEGATIEEIMAETQWLGHTVRGAVAGALKKKLGLEVRSEKDVLRGRVYRLPAA